MSFKSKRSRLSSNNEDFVDPIIAAIKCFNNVAVESGLREFSMNTFLSIKKKKTGVCALTGLEKKDDQKVSPVMSINEMVMTFHTPN